MAQNIQRLSALAVARASKLGLYADGAGLYLRVGRGGAKSWAFRFMLNGKAREMGFGSFTKVGLADARKKAIDARRLLSEGHDPLVHREEEEKQRAAAENVAAARSMTFDKCAEAYISAHEVSWQNDKHRQQWRNTLSTYVSPVFGSVPVQDVGIDLIMKVVEPLWSAKTETARRVRGRIEVILDWAKVRGYRTGENPARWRGHLDHLLPARSKVRAVKHHAALSYTEMGAFMQDLRKMEGASAAALEFLILTVARTGEIIGARWSEINLKDRVWVVPAARMKSGREHRVPLSSAAIAILKRMPGSKDDYPFVGQRPGAPLSNMALLMLLGRMNRGDITAHGFRSTFRDWAAERSNFAREVVEMALAHVVEDKTEAAYRRGDLFDKRRRLMDAWAEYCGKPATPSKVVVLKSG
jgi:integrase